MRRTGELERWDDARGFGFIRAADGASYFVHVSDIERGANRPTNGMKLSFAVGQGRNGQPAAILAHPLRADIKSLRRAHVPAPARPAPRDFRPYVAAAFVALLVFAVLVGSVPLWMGAAYLVLGIVSFVQYGADKTYAQTGQWRISEAMLLGLDLAGGIIGGLLAQSHFRHKTRKPEFVLSTWVIFAVHALWLAGMGSGLISADELAELGALLPR
jgi:uncharacterized membrane protein YsdA (DUF1294 family)/cold shock CspA family protein